MLRQARAGRLLMNEVVRRLLAVAHRQGAVLVQIGDLRHLGDYVVNRNLPQGVASLLGGAQVARHQAAIGLTYLGDRLAGGEVDDISNVERFVRLAPA